MVKYSANFMLFVKSFRHKLLTQPIYGEDYEKHWSFLTLEGKSIIDFGADYGSSANYFLKRGAAKVVAVEGSYWLFRILKRNFKNRKDVVCLWRFLKKPSDFEKIIAEYPCDLAKVDVEGAEIYLLNASNLANIKEWMIETHSETTAKKLQHKLVKCGFSIETTMYGENTIILATKL